jgi:hypothetical protein
MQLSYRLPCAYSLQAIPALITAATTKRKAKEENPPSLGAALVLPVAVAVAVVPLVPLVPIPHIINSNPLPHERY